MGLITGDVSINPDASCLIMTTGKLQGGEGRGGEEKLETRGGEEKKG